jgi:hypothetical protein
MTTENEVMNTEAEEQETQVIQLPELQGLKEDSQAANINPETGKAFTPNERVIMLVENLCQDNGIQMRDVANAMSQSLQKQINLQKKELELFTTARNAQVNKVEYKELVAREINAQKTIDNHTSEMRASQKALVEGVLHQLELTSITEEQKAVAKQVSEMFGYKLADLKNANDAEINRKATVFAKEMFEGWKNDEANKPVPCNPTARKKSWF